MNKISPIIIFTYKRLNTLKISIESLKKNNLCKKSKLYIFSDAAKNFSDEVNVKNVRKYIKKIKGFKKIQIVLRKKNYGLAKNITKGLSEIFKINDSAIILEDDIVVSKNFLSYMNYCLNYFKNEKKVWHINSWNFNFKLPHTKENVYYWRVMNCWGWGTWKNRWKKYKKNPEFLIKNWDKSKIRKFNLDGGYNYWSQILRNSEKKINTWAVFWYSTIFENEGLCVSPKKTHSINIGFDNFSTNHPDQKITYKKNKVNILAKSQNKIILQKEMIENKFLYDSIKKKLIQPRFRFYIKKVIDYFLN